MCINLQNYKQAPHKCVHPVFSGKILSGQSPNSVVKTSFTVLLIKHLVSLSLLMFYFQVSKRYVSSSAEILPFNSMQQLFILQSYF